MRQLWSGAGWKETPSGLQAKGHRTTPAARDQSPVQDAVDLKVVALAPLPYSLIPAPSMDLGS